MKLLFAFLSFCASSISCLSAEIPADARPTLQEAEALLKAETPVERQAFKMFDSIASLPALLDGVKDAETLEAAEVKFEKMLKQYKKEVAALAELEVPDLPARRKLHAKMEVKVDLFQEELRGMMLGQMSLPKDIGIRVESMVKKFEKTVDEEKQAHPYFDITAEKVDD